MSFYFFFLFFDRVTVFFSSFLLIEGSFLCSFKRYSNKSISVFCRYRTNTSFFSSFYFFLLSFDRAIVFFPAFFFSTFFFSASFFSAEIITGREFFFYNFRRYSDKSVLILYRYRTNTFFFSSFLFLFLSFDKATVFFSNFFFSVEIFLSSVLSPVEDFFFIILGGILKNSLISLNKIDKLNSRI